MSRITQTGQITLPKEFREILGVGVRDQVELLSDGSRVEIRAVPDEPLSLGTKEEFWARVQNSDEQYAAGEAAPANDLIDRMRSDHGL
ncbi:MAG: AbrB/MazE/SpoVT family DNA-binding domain-containing protein [Atopobiaceae bacterium]|nr:AbrB/MazE/SpoVT family DNA-binding domain-containing protein [Atopobiaceae bacterium]